MRFRMDKFKVPAAARGEFLERVRATHQILKAQPGFVSHAVFEQTGGPGTFNFVTLAEWESMEAIEAAKKSVAAKFAEIGFDPNETRTRLGIEADIAVHTQVAEVC